jgi:hypothetical protein
MRELIAQFDERLDVEGRPIARNLVEAAQHFAQMRVISDWILVDQITTLDLSQIVRAPQTEPRRVSRRPDYVSTTSAAETVWRW